MIRASAAETWSLSLPSLRFFCGWQPCVLLAATAPRLWCSRYPGSSVCLGANFLLLLLPRLLCPPWHHDAVGVPHLLCIGILYYRWEKHLCQIPQNVFLPLFGLCPCLFFSLSLSLSVSLSPAILMTDAAKGVWLQASGLKVT